LTTYLPDQWLRLWFLGGKAEVEYSRNGQLEHTSPEVFATELRRVWANLTQICRQDAQLIIRFGAINCKKAKPTEIIKYSLEDSGWRIAKYVPAGSAAKGKRQAAHFSFTKDQALEEFDVWAVRS
jgi:hypothetical protein